VAIVPLWRKDGEQEIVLPFAESVRDALVAAGVRVAFDTRERMKPGAKYYDWERKGVPLRLEIGPRDVAQGSAFAARRLGGAKFPIPAEGIADTVTAELEKIQTELLQRARDFQSERTFDCDTYEDFKAQLIEKGGWTLVPWCDDAENEAQIKTDTKATIRCFPHGRQAEAEGRSCFYSQRPATHMALFGRAY
jgi:prolyl-tRNA synthetase